VRNRDRALFHVAACQGNEPAEEDLTVFEASCGFRLPTEFREFTMSGLGGLYVEAREEVWPPAKEFQVGPFWTFLRGVKVFGIAHDIPEWLDIRVQYAEMSEQGYPNLVPFLAREGDPSRYCFNAAGAIVEWHLDDPDEPELVGASFSELLHQQLVGLEERTRRRLRGEHS
jgi:hypothetical protein